MIHISFNLVYVCTYRLIIAVVLYGAMILYAKLAGGGLETLAVMSWFAVPAYVVGIISLAGLVVAGLTSGWGTSP